MRRYERDSTGAPVFAYQPPKRRKETAPRDDPEARLQRQVVEYFRFALPHDVLWTSTLNGAHLGASQRMKQKAQGLRPGIADFVLVKPNGAVKMIELKSDGGRLTPEQAVWARVMGDAWATCRTVEEVEAALLRWCVVVLAPLSRANRYVVT
jgi:VRR-NUC domain